MNQSELLAITSNLLKARDKPHVQSAKVRVRVLGCGIFQATTERRELWTII